MTMDGFLDFAKTPEFLAVVATAALGVMIIKDVIRVFLGDDR